MKKLFAMMAVLLILLSTAGCGGEKDYETARKSVESFLSANRAELEAIAQQALRDGASSEAAVKGVSYMEVSGDRVTFEIGSQGMLGGQYWHLVYTEDGTYHGEAKRYVYKEENGNNVAIAQHLQGNWFFHWMDYDGREDLTNRYIDGTSAS